MLTKRQKRTTRQIRVSSKIHKALKLCAFEREITVSKLADELFGEIPEVRGYMVHIKKIEKAMQSKLSKQLYEKTEKERGVFEKFNTERGS